MEEGLGQTCTVPSSLAEAIWVPSGDHADRFPWQEEFENPAVESCAHLCKTVNSPWALVAALRPTPGRCQQAFGEKQSACWTDSG
ncbi:MAG TPA: hypothetical protein VM709_03875, partial [Candidatus Sulfotelmatobacter sp.]|nr:hypothetical protein [Candidatus Sulfotelmatobacter sp.]